MVWVLIVAFTMSLSPTPVILPPETFADQSSCERALNGMSAADLQPFKPPGSRIIAVRSACAKVDLSRRAPAPAT